jgi:hypothetical protein
MNTRSSAASEPTARRAPPRSHLRPGGRPLRAARPGRAAVDRTRLTAVVVAPRWTGVTGCVGAVVVAPRRTGVTRARRGVVVPRLGRLDLSRTARRMSSKRGYPWDRVGVASTVASPGPDEHGIPFVSCLVVPSCHLALLVPARPRCSGHSCLSWRRFGRPRTWLIGFARGISQTGTVGAATQPTPTGGSGIPARSCDSRLSLRTSRGTHGPSTPTRMRRTRLPRPAALEERHRAPEARLVARVCRR